MKTALGMDEVPCEPAEARRTRDTARCARERRALAVASAQAVVGRRPAVPFRSGYVRLPICSGRGDVGGVWRGRAPNSTERGGVVLHRGSGTRDRLACDVVSPASSEQA